MTRYIKAGILGGIVLFVWGFISWTILPWHAMTLHSFKSDVAVSQMIEANAPASGIYILPSMQPGQSTQSTAQPMIFASIKLTGVPSNMVTPMVIGLITQIIAAFLVTWLLSGASKLGYLGRVGFVLIVALTATVICNVPAWNWFGFDTQYTLVMMADTLIGWFFAGLILARYAK